MIVPRCPVRSACGYEGQERSETERGNPPVVRLVEPADPNIGDPVGAARTFTAACDQPATMTVYLNGTLVHTSASGVQQVSYTVPSAPLGQHMVRVVAANANGTGENYWTWNVVSTPPVITSVLPVSDCLVDTTESFFQRTFEIITDIASKIRVYVNDVLTFAQETYSTVMSWIFDRTTTPVNPDPFVNIIRIVVENTNGTTEKIIYSIITQAPVTSAPVITSASPAEHTITNIAGSPSRRTFGVTVDQPATIIFSGDGREKCRFSAVTDATWECDFSGYSAGIHSVVVTASNSNGSDSFTWSWEILEKPAITFVTPSADNVSNYDAEGKRVFHASVNIPCLLELYLNDRLLKKSSSEDTAIFHEFGPVLLGIYSVKVVAIRDDVKVERSWNWNVSKYTSINNEPILLTDHVRVNYNHYGDYYAEIDLILTYDKVQFSSGDWVYSFTLVISSYTRDVEGNLPPVIHPSEPVQYATGFRDIKFMVDKVSNKEKQVLLSSLDSFCFNHYPIPEGGYLQYVKNQKIEDIFGKLFTFVPYLGTVLETIDIFNTICTPTETLYNIEQIKFDIHHPLHIPTTYSSFSWFVRVESEHTVSFKIYYSASDDPIVNISIEKIVEIEASNDPVIL